METIKILGSKKNSVVKLVKINDSQYVAKYYMIHSKSMMIEVNILSTSKHTNIVPLIKLLSPTFETPIGICMPALGDSLLNILKHNKIPMPNKIDFLLQIAHGLRYLHYNHIIHFDLKSENIMITNGTAHIIDFGLAEYIFSDKIYTPQIKCTATHRAPEAFTTDINNKYILDYNFDIWSLGIIIFELFSDTAMYEYRLTPKYKPQKYVSQFHVTDNLILSKLKIAYEKDYNNRMYQFITSANFKNAINKIVPEKLISCLNMNPSDRPNIDTVITNLKRMQNDPTKIYDDNTKLILVGSNYYNHNAESYRYCERVFHMVTDKYPTYPYEIIYSVFDLVHRLAIIINKFDHTYIDQAIILCNNLLTISDTIQLNDFITNINYHTKKIILDNIILATNGVLFQYHFYVNKLDGYQMDYSIMTSGKYLQQSQRLIELINHSKK